MARDQRVDTEENKSAADVMKEVAAESKPEDSDADVAADDKYNDEEGDDAGPSQSDEVDSWDKPKDASNAPQGGSASSKQEVAGKTKETEPTDGTVEYVQAAGQKVKINYTDRKAIRDAHIRAAGMRKFQAERDTFRKTAETLLAREKVNQEKLTLLSHLEKAFEERGVEGAIEVISGGKQTLKDIIEERNKRSKLYEDATDDERKILEYEERLSRRDREQAKLTKRISELETKTKESSEATQVQQLQGMVNTVFDQVRFAGKLNDSDAEEELDNVLFERLRETLAQVPEGKEITQAFIREQARTIANRLSKVIKTQAGEQAREVSEASKRAAKGTAQVAAAKGGGDSDAKAEFARKIKSGQATSALLDVIRGRVKL